MTPEQEIKLIESVAKLETILSYKDKVDSKNEEKLDLILVQINKSNAEREADIISLKVSLKNKINDKFDELKNYHDEDLKPLKKNSFFIVGNNKVANAIFWCIILFSFWKQINNVLTFQAKKHGLKDTEYTMPVLRGETLLKDSIKYE